MFWEFLLHISKKSGKGDGLAMLVFTMAEHLVHHLSGSAREKIQFPGNQTFHKTVAVLNGCWFRDHCQQCLVGVHKEIEGVVCGAGTQIEDDEISLDLCQLTHNFQFLEVF